MITIQEAVYEEIADQMGWSESERKGLDNAYSLEYIKMDSLDVVDLIGALEIRFRIDIFEDEMDEHFKMKSTVGEIVEFVTKKFDQK